MKQQQQAAPASSAPAAVRQAPVAADPFLALQAADGGGNQAVLDRLNGTRQRRKLAPLDHPVFYLVDDRAVLDQFSALWRECLRQDRGEILGVEVETVIPKAYTEGLPWQANATRFEDHPELYDEVRHKCVEGPLGCSWDSEWRDDGTTDWLVPTADASVRLRMDTFVQDLQPVHELVGTATSGSATTRTSGSSSTQGGSGSARAEPFGVGLSVGGKADASRSSSASDASSDGWSGAAPSTIVNGTLAFYLQVDMSHPIAGVHTAAAWVVPGGTISLGAIDGVGWGR